MFFLSSSDVKYYKVLTGKTLSTTQWAKKCRDRGGRLASITNAAEQAMATAAVRTSPRPYIITAMKRITPHSKTFVDGFGFVQTYL